MGFELYSRLKLNILSSVHDNPNAYDFDEINKEYLRYIDYSHPVLESSVIKLFQINLINLIKNKVGLSKNFNIPPSEIDRMYYWEYEYLLEEVNSNIKEENERQEKENGKYGDINPRSMMRNAHSMMPKSSGFSTPKIPSIPSFGH
jgi:hypothetical protein